jgi:3'(2'), 5'-bisphosphate nucleotidase
MAYDSETQVAIAAASTAAKLCEHVRCNRTPDAIEKQDSSPVTIADFGAQALICRAITAAFPQATIVAEEDSALLRQASMSDALQQVATHVQVLVPDATVDAVLHWIDQGNGQVSNRYWTLDPIDGTKGFLRGDQYAIALALIEAGEVKVGVMACPALPLDQTQTERDQGVLFVAVRGQGSRLISLTSGQSQSIQVTHSDDAAHLRLIESIEAGHGNLSQQRLIAQSVGLAAPPIQMDSQAKYGVVARGDAALYLRLPRTQTPDYRENIWDHAAGAIVVEEAGGRVTDMYGAPLDFSQGAKLVKNRGIVASNGVVHDAVLAALQQADI